MWQTTPRIPTPDVGHLRPVAVDTETYLFGPGRMAPPLVCVSICEEGKSPKLFNANDGAREVARLLNDPDVLLVFHNAPYDLFVLANHADGAYVPLRDVIGALMDNRIVDTGLWHRLYDIKNGWTEYSPRIGRKPTYRLDELTLFWLGESVQGKKGDDAWRMRYHELAGDPIDQWPDAARAYAANDAWYTIRVWQQQYREDRVLPSLFSILRASVALTAGSYHGLRTSTYDVDRLAYKSKRDTEKQQEELYSKGYLKVTKTKGVWRFSQNKAFIENTVVAAYDRLGITCPLTEGGKGTEEERAAKRKPSTSAETLLASQHEDLITIAEIAGDQKLLSTYVPLLRRGTKWPICPRYTIPMATGRTSASAPNVQNQPRKGGVRECFVPRKGYIFVGCDYNIAELRSLAQVLINMFGRSKMADIILEGKDVHSFMAAEYLRSGTDEHGDRFKDLTYEEYVHLLKNGPKDIRKLFKDMRQMMKAVDFGVPGGLGEDTLREYAHAAYGVEMKPGTATEDSEARKLINFYKGTFDEMADYFSHFSKMTRGGNKFTLVQAGSMRERGNTGYCDGCNSGFQGLTADGATYAVWNVFFECYLGIKWDNWEERSPLYQSRMPLFVHDEIVLESPIGMAQECAARLEKIMCDSMNVYTPDIPAVAEPHMMRRWYKDAEPTFRCLSCCSVGFSAKCKKCDSGVGTELIPWSPQNPAVALRDVKMTKEMEDALRAVGYFDTSRKWTSEDVEFLTSMQEEGEIEPDVHPNRRTNLEWMVDVWDMEVRARENNPDPWM